MDAQVRTQLIPPLSYELHKGQAGRIAVLGGSTEYCGAPYFAAMAAMRMGADLAYIICENSAAPVIKSYSPELIVYPYLTTREHVPAGRSESQIKSDIVGRVLDLLSRFHVLVIGPGLGREEFTLDCVEQVILEARKIKLPLVIDGDGLFLVTQKPQLVQGHENIVLTPNLVEFKRLCEKLNVDSKDAGEGPARELAKALGNVTIVRKSQQDVVTDGNESHVCKAEGSPRRCGGQGDILAGATATFLAWSLKHPLVKLSQGIKPSIIAAFGACMLTRECARLACAKTGRSTTTTELLAHIPQAFNNIAQGSLGPNL